MARDEVYILHSWKQENNCKFVERNQDDKQTKKHEQEIGQQTTHLKC